MLELLAFEEASEKLTTRMAVQQALIPVIDLKHIKGYVQDLHSSLAKNIALKDADMVALTHMSKTVSTTTLTRLFTAMQKSGIIRAVEATDENMNTDAFRAKIQRDLAAGIIKPLAGIGER